MATLERTNVQVQRGAFDAELGPLFIDMDGTLFLEVAVRSAADADFDVLPRVLVTSVPFARRAAYAERAGSVDWSQVVNAPVPLQGETGPVGPQGPVGAQGPVGPQGVSVIGSSEPPGANCVEGGIRFESGAGIQYVCNGVSVFGSTEPAGADCPAGGVRLVTANGDQVLCNGVAGPQGIQGVADRRASRVRSGPSV